jgi:formate dehydrogenase beta subunit
VKPTNIGGHEYFHKVVDCQWACPAHTPVPEYIRLIAAGRLFGRLHDQLALECLPRHSRPRLRPALRAGLPPRPRGQGAGGHLPPQACRADLKDDIHDRLPQAGEKNGKRIACVGAGPASLTVARDLAVLGYQVTVFDNGARRAA